MNTMKAMAVLLMFVLVCQPLIAQTQTMDENQAAIKARLDQIPIGKTIDVKLLQKGHSKIKGKLLSVASDSFEIQTRQSGKVTSERIAFADVKSVKQHRMPLWGKIALGFTAAVVVAALILAANSD